MLDVEDLLKIPSYIRNVSSGCTNNIRFYPLLIYESEDMSSDPQSSMLRSL